MIEPKLRQPSPGQPKPALTQLKQLGTEYRELRPRSPSTISPPLRGGEGGEFVPWEPECGVGAANSRSDTGLPARKFILAVATRYSPAGTGLSRRDGAARRNFCL